MLISQGWQFRAKVKSYPGIGSRLVFHWPASLGSGAEGQKGTDTVGRETVHSTVQYVNRDPHSRPGVGERGIDGAVTGTLPSVIVPRRRKNDPARHLDNGGGVGSGQR